MGCRPNLQSAANLWSMAAPRAGDREPWVLAAAHDAMPGVERAMFAAARRLKPAGVPLPEAVAAVAIVIADDLIIEEIAREQAIQAEAERRRAGTPTSTGHELLGRHLGVSRQTIRKRLRLPGRRT